MAQDHIQLGSSLTVNIDYVKKDGTALPINGAILQEAVLKGPTTRLVITTSFVTDGTDGKVTGTVDAGVIDEVGEWKIQGEVHLSGTPNIEHKSSIECFEVDGNL